MKKEINIPKIIVGVLLAFLLGILLWGIITQNPEIDPKGIKEAVEAAGKAFGN